jgi:hypothetical protein
VLHIGVVLLTCGHSEQPLLRVAGVLTPHDLHVNSTDRAVFSENTVQSSKVVLDHSHLVIGTAYRSGGVHKGARGLEVFRGVELGSRKLSSNWFVDF